MAVTVAAERKCTNMWKDSNEPGESLLIMHILGVVEVKERIYQHSRDNRNIRYNETASEMNTRK
jgi:hypothetical protein